MIEQRPLPDFEPDPIPEPKLELLPALDEVDEKEEKEAPSHESDPLKLYVRQIGDGRLLTPVEERELARRKDAGEEGNADADSSHQ